MNTWPDGAMTPFRSEKNTNWEGAFRVPCMIRWPGKIKAGSVSNEIVSGHDWMPDVPRRGRRAGHQGEAPQGARGGRQDLQGPPRRLQSIALSDRPGRTRARGGGSSTSTTTATSSPCGIENWKIVFMEQRAPGTLRVWAEPFTPLRLPKLFDLRADPYERADITSNTYYDWFISQPYLFFAGQAHDGNVPEDLQGVPAPAEGRELQHRPGDGEDEANAQPVGDVRPAIEMREPTMALRGLLRTSLSLVAVMIAPLAPGGGRPAAVVERRAGEAGHRPLRRPT